MEYSFLKNERIKNFLSQFDEIDRDKVIEELLLMSINKINEDSYVSKKEEIIEKKSNKTKGKILILNNDVRNNEQIFQNSLQSLNNNSNFTFNKQYSSFEDKLNMLSYKLNNINKGNNQKKK
jgi:hypothetical protein